MPVALSFLSFSLGFLTKYSKGICLHFCKRSVNKIDYSLDLKENLEAKFNPFTGIGRELSGIFILKLSQLNHSRKPMFSLQGSSFWNQNFKV